MELIEINRQMINKIKIFCIDTYKYYDCGNSSIFFPDK